MLNLKRAGFTANQIAIYQKINNEMDQSFSGNT